MISQKCQYAIRAVFELAQQAEQGRSLLKIEAIAKRQAIPVRFLENILNQLRGGRFVESERGRNGGYRLVRDPAGISVGELIRFVDGPIGPIACTDDASKKCPLYGGCVFLDVWTRARQAMENVYDETTIAALLAEDRRLQEQHQQRGIHYDI